jgi:hypothetical protein
VAEALEARARAATGTDRIAARWKVESLEAIRRTLTAVVADEAGRTRGLRPR